MRYRSTVGVAPSEVAAYATEIARIFGSSLTFEAPADSAACDDLRTRVAALLAEVRPHPDGPSLAEGLRLLTDAARRGELGASRSTRHLSELESLFVQAAFRRTKRAERGRLFAQLVVLFGLERALGIDAAVERDAEAHLRRVRRALRGS